MDVLVDSGWSVARGAGRLGLIAALLLGPSATGLAQAPARENPADRTAASQPASRDEALWSAICQAERESRSVDPFTGGAETALRLRRKLLEQVRLYLSAYPGGRRCDEVVRLELKALFEIGTLSGGTYEPLSKQVQEYLLHPPSAGALHEAAYWAIRCRRLARTASTSQPSSAPVKRLDDELLEAYRDYIERYPRSRHVPLLTTRLFEAAAGRADRDEQRRLVARLGRDFPEHAVTAMLKAQLRRADAPGRPFALEFETPDGTRIDTGQWKDQPVLIVVWAGFSERARTCVGRVELFRRAHPRLRVVGVNLDESEQRMRAACDELGLPWPQFNDGLGWANRFALEWGVREVPWVFVVDSQGRLAGSSGDEHWMDLAASVLEN